MAFVRRLRAETSWLKTPTPLMMASPATRATRIPRQTQAVARQRRASHPAVTSLATSMATAMAMTEFGAPGKITTIPLIENQAAALASATAATYAAVSTESTLRHLG